MVSLVFFFVVFGVDVVEAQVLVLLEGARPELDGDAGVWLGLEWIRNEGVRERVDQDHREGALALAHIREVLQKDCNSRAELRVAVHEGVVFLEVVADFLQQALYSRKDSSECSVAEFKLNLRQVDRAGLALHSKEGTLKRSRFKSISPSTFRVMMEAFSLIYPLFLVSVEWAPQ